MPIYEYDCSICNEKFEKLIRNIHILDVQCPSCGSEKIVRKFSVFGVKNGETFSASSGSQGGCSSGGCGNCGCH